MSLLLLGWLLIRNFILTKSANYCMIQRCVVLSATRMRCIMPLLNLDQEFDTGQAGSQGGNGSNLDEPGVAVLMGKNGKNRADIYVGFVLDAVPTYRNISATNPSIKMQFFAQPTLSCMSATTSSTTHVQNSGKPIVIGVSQGVEFAS